MLKLIGKDNKVSYPFLETPDECEEMMYLCLMQSKPFVTVKGKVILEAWALAVEEINQQRNKATNLPLFDPPIAAKTVRNRFDNTMKLVKEIDQDTPFCSGCDDEESPNTMRQLLEDLYKLKTSFDDDQSGQKSSALALKKNDCDAAKAIQEAAVGRYSASSASDTSDKSGQKPK
jgi:hypothetical protein